MNDINQQFDKLIDEICGPMIGSKPKHQTYDYIRRDRFHEYEKWERQERYRHRLEKETIASIHVCNNCGCSFEVYTEPIPLIQYQDYNFETGPIVGIEHEDFYCIKCGMMFRVTGKIKYIENKFRR